jgi:hypothetical protein
LRKQFIGAGARDETVSPLEGDVLTA